MIYTITRSMASAATPLTPLSNVCFSMKMQSRLAICSHYGYCCPTARPDGELTCAHIFELLDIL